MPRKKADAEVEPEDQVPEDDDLEQDDEQEQDEEQEIEDEAENLAGVGVSLSISEEFVSVEVPRDGNEAKTLEMVGKLLKGLQ